MTKHSSFLEVLHANKGKGPTVVADLRMVKKVECTLVQAVRPIGGVEV